MFLYEEAGFSKVYEPVQGHPAGKWKSRKAFQPDGITYAMIQKHETAWHFEETRLYLQGSKHRA